METVGVEPWELHIKTKYEIEFVFSKTVEGLSHYLHKYSSYKERNTTGEPIISEETLPHDVYDTTSEEK